MFNKIISFNLRNMELIVDRSVQKLFSMIAGLFFAYLGYKLFINGVSGNASLSAKKDKISLQLLNASPGLFFALFGALIIIYSVLQKETFIQKIEQDGTYIKMQEKSVNNLKTQYSIYYNQGMKYYKERKYKKAITYFEKAIESIPDYSLAYNALAWVYMEMETNLDEGVKLVLEALKLKPNNPNYLDTLASLYYKKGENNKAIEVIRKAIKIDPSNKKYLEKLKIYESAIEK